MKRRVFYSFCYKDDVFRVNQVRHIGEIEDNSLVHKNDFEKIKQSGNAAIKRWIDSQLDGRTCTVVLAGRNTATRPWVQYEIRESWRRRMGVLVVYIHNLKNEKGEPSKKGDNPLDYVPFDGKTPLSVLELDIDPEGNDSKEIYQDISNNLQDWIEDAIEVRERFP